MNMTVETSVPVVDFAALTGAAAGKDQAMSALDSACRKSGFFYLTRHGISHDSIIRVWRQVNWFFSLPADKKLAVARSESNSRGYYNQELTKNIRDMKEVFDFGHIPFPELPEQHNDNKTLDGWNQWPDVAGHHEFKKTLNLYYQACRQVAIGLLRAITSNLGAAVDTLVGDFHPGHSSFLRLNYYPIIDPLGNGPPGNGPRGNDPSMNETQGARTAAESGHMGVHHHTDAGALTLLLQDDVGGLEIFSDRQWIPVAPMDGTLVVNIGDIVQVWSNDRYKAPLHRVLASQGKDRLSLPYFFNPIYSADYAPLPEAIDAGDYAHYSPINWAHFRKQRQHGDYGDYGDEIQVSDFRL